MHAKELRAWQLWPNCVLLVNPGSNYAVFHYIPDGPERTALYEQMTHIVSDQVPWVTRTHRIRQNLQQPWLSGFKYTEVNEQYWQYAGIDGAAREIALEEWNQPIRWPIYASLVGFLGLLGVGLRKRKGAT